MIVTSSTWSKNMRAHLICGGFPPGSAAGHDMDYVRIQLLELLSEHEIRSTVSSDFAEIEKWLSGCQLLVTYTAGPFPDDQQSAQIDQWLSGGGRWVALHGTSGGKAARIAGQKQRKMVKLAHHKSLGSFFLNHPPVRKFEVKVQVTDHPLMHGLPPTFELTDELYLIEMQDPTATILLTTELPRDPSPPGFGFTYDEDTALEADGKTRVLGYVREVGDGAVAYWALGHCHSPKTNSQPFVDKSVTEDGTTPLTFHGVWETPEFQKLLNNSVRWATS